MISTGKQPNSLLKHNDVGRMTAAFAIAVFSSFCLSVSSCSNTGEDEAAKNPVFATITAEEAVVLMTARGADPQFLILDVRTPAEYSPEHIRNAVNIDVNAPHFDRQLDLLDKNNAYLVYCWSGARSGRATEIMRQLGFNEVYDLEGGLNALKQLGGTDLPLVSCGCD